MTWSYHLGGLMGSLPIKPAGNVRHWDGQDGKYLVLPVDQQWLDLHKAYSLLEPGERIWQRDPFNTALGVFVIKEVTVDNRMNARVASCVDLASYERIHKVVANNPDRYGKSHGEYLAPVQEVVPPKFTSVQDADAWLALQDVPRQLHANGTLLEWDREVAFAQQASGLVLPKSFVTFTGKVVGWRGIDVTSVNVMPQYLMLTNAWMTQDPETVWVPAHELREIE